MVDLQTRIQRAGDVTARTVAAGGCGDCDHTPEEHAIFDLGVADAELGLLDACPENLSPDLREVYWTGHSAGLNNA